MADNNIPERLRDRIKPPQNRSERDLQDITHRLQGQVNELFERVTGIRQIKRQYLTLGLTVGVLVGVILGILIGMLMHAVADDQPQNT